MPVIERDKVLSQSGENWDLLLRVVIHDLLSQEGSIRLCCAIASELLMNKALHCRLPRSVRDLAVWRSEIPVKFDVVAVNSVIRVIDDLVVVRRLTAGGTSGSIGEIVWVTEWARVDGVVETLGGLAAEEVVHGAVLHDQHDEVLDLALHVLHRARRPTRSRIDCSHKGEQTGQEAGLHVTAF